MDALSGVLDSVSIVGSVFCHGEVRVPWCFSGGREGSCLFHVLVDGDAVVRAGAEEFRMTSGDVLLLPRGSTHEVGSGAGAASRALRESVETAPGGFARLKSGGDGLPATLICGTFDIEGMDWHPLLRVLPNVILVNSGSARWLHQTLVALQRQVDDEALGSTLVANRLAEVLFVQVVAAWLTTTDGGQPWVRALGDAQVGRALASMHSAPGRPWTAELLAQEVGMSRSSFYRRFSELVGQPPARYLSAWRMALAARWLAHDERTLTETSIDLGYSGVPAFSRAFKSHFGTTPGTFRRESRAASET